MSSRPVRGATRLAVVVVAGSVAAVAGGDEASANPPAPERFPDPFVVAPKAAERPNVVRKHDGGCFVYYPSGGTAKVECPKELLPPEPVGQEIDRDETTGKCRHIPMTSWSGGSTGEIPCPAVLLVVAKPGVMPDPSASASGATSNSAPVPSTFDPPMGGLQPQTPATVAPKSKDPSKRKDDDSAPKATGCASSCTIGSPDARGMSTGGECALALAALAVTISRRARRALR